MLSKEEESRRRTIIGLILAIVILSVLINIKKQSAQAKAQTNIEVMAFVGVPAENKVGGIEFTVSDRWEYDRVIFQVWGFDEGLKLDNVICFVDGEKHDFDQWDDPAVDLVWKDFLEKFQEILAEATIGGKYTDLLDPRTISVTAPNTPGSE